VWIPHCVVVDGTRWDATRRLERVTAEGEGRPGHLISNGDEDRLTRLLYIRVFMSIQFQGDYLNRPNVSNLYEIG